MSAENATFENSSVESRAYKTSPFSLPGMDKVELRRGARKGESS